MAGIAKSGPEPSSRIRTISAVTLAKATGIKLRGRHSKSSSSTASRIAASGAAKVADMPAAAPATSSVVRSASVRCIHCATSEPNAPPVMMIGPSAPNGPPEPMEMAAEIGLSTAMLGSTLAPFSRMASIASGMPWPRILSEPKRAIRPTITPPTMGTRTIQMPSGLPAGRTDARLKRW